MSVCARACICGVCARACVRKAQATATPQISLSLAPEGGRGGAGQRLFLMRRNGIEEAEHGITLGHGDMVTMEGLFQSEWQHSVWPGDDTDKAASEQAPGERMNLTWRWLRQHLPGCPAAGATATSGERTGGARM
eukprot:COSAG01_NODE_2741_length_7157_cov_10.590677_8_plen_135_part_00